MNADQNDPTAAPWDADALERAWAFATRQHHGQTYGGPSEGERIDYLGHIGNVVMEVMWSLQAEPGADADLALQCAVLHDTVEDTGVSPAQLVAEFGPAVADGVLALSKDPALPTKALQMQDSLDRIRRQPPAVWRVKLADRIANLAAPPHYWTDEKILAYQAESRLILEALRPASAALAARLEARIGAYGRFLGQTGPSIG